MENANSRGSASLFEKKSLDLLKENSSTPTSKTNKLMKWMGINPRDTPEIQKQLLFANTLSSDESEGSRKGEER